jgi:hypothetical protein
MYHLADRQLFLLDSSESPRQISHRNRTLALRARHFPWGGEALLYNCREDGFLGSEPGALRDRALLGQHLDQLPAIRDGCQRIASAKTITAPISLDVTFLIAVVENSYPNNNFVMAITHRENPTHNALVPEAI